MRNYLLQIVASLSVLGLSIPCATADVLEPYQIEAVGKYVHLKMTPEFKNFTAGSVYFVTSGNNSTSLAELYIEGPSGIRVTARTGQLGSKDAATMLAGSRGWGKAPLMTSTKPKGTDSVVLSGEPGETASANLYVHVRRDSCAAKSIKYITEFKFDLSGVDPALTDAGYVVNFGSKDYPYQNGRRASIKPSSDGKYKGEPIGLFETISYENEYLNIVTWGGGAIKKQQRTPIVKYVSYKGISLSLARLKQFLTGGKATFELTNGSNVYSVCFDRQRRRQSVNGYPNP